MPEPVLELDGVEVRYGSVAAVRDVRLRVDEGEIVGLIGPNGAGKSTTLHAIMGVVPSSAGEIRLRGRSLRRKSSESIGESSPGSRSRRTSASGSRRGAGTAGEATRSTPPTTFSRS